MKTKFKYVMMMALALTIGFSSCSNDNAGLNPDNPEGQPASLNLTLVDNGSANAMTYAPPTGATEAASPSESAITAANQHIYIFDATGALEHYGQILAGITLTSGNKKIYMIAKVVAPVFATFNPTVGNAAATEANLLLEKFTLTAPADIAELTTDNSFYISNVGGPGSVNIAPGANNMSLNVGRGVAKINIDMTNASPPATGTLTSPQYLIANNPADMFFVPNYLAGQLQTPFFNSTGASDYFNNGTVTATDITLGLKVADGDALNRSYATENAIALAHISYKTISYAIIQGVFAPTKVVLSTNATTTYTPGADFHRIMYIETDGAVIYDRGYYTAFVVGTVPAAGDQVYADAALAMPTSLHGGTVTANVVTYKGSGVGALCYYQLGLGDSRITTAGQETERFTVERNKYYYYEVASVADCGSSTPVPPVTVPEVTSVLGITFTTGPWGVVGGAGGLTPGI